MNRPTLLIIDGLNVIRRVYGANPAPDSPEKAVGAIKASYSSFLRGIKEHRPTHVMVAFDAGGNTWRHDLFADYKKDRNPMPEPLQVELVKFKRFLTDGGWGLVEHPGFEADDTIGSASLEALDIGSEVVILSTDKDMVCLDEIGARVRDHFSGIWHDEQWCLTKFGIPPSLILDWLALMGDANDGIPGVDGVGAKTATKLLIEYGSLNGVLNAAADIKGKVGENLRSQKSIALLSRELTTLKLDLFPAGLDWNALKCSIDIAAIH